MALGNNTPVDEEVVLQPASGCGDSSDDEDTTVDMRAQQGESGGSQDMDVTMDHSMMDCSALDMSMISTGGLMRGGGDCGAITMEDGEEEALDTDDGSALDTSPESAATNASRDNHNTQHGSLRDPILRVAGRCTALSADLSTTKSHVQKALLEMGAACAASVEQVCRRSAQEIAQYRGELDTALVEKRRLHNCIQEMKGNIRVFCRVRPSKEAREQTAVECRKGGQILTVDLPSKGIDRNGNPRKADQKTFAYDAVFGPSTSQGDVYGEVQGMVDSCYDGYHCTVIAYGQTGSGKTFTMQGSEEQPGISKRALGDIFEQKVRREAGGLQSVNIRVSMIEVYNESFRDLLSERSASKDKIDVRESSSGSVTIHGATHVTVASPEDVEEVTRRGQANRAVASTRSNDHSSRSHMVLMIDVEVRERCNLNKGRVMLSGRLSLVDLAGSERISKSEASGSALTEAKHINKSLSALIDVMCALSERDKKEKATAAQKSKPGADSSSAGSPLASHIPFRNSKLTHLLMGSLKPGSKLVFITQVAPESVHVNETCNTLDFGARAKGLDLGKTKQSAVKAVSLENAERQNEALAKELDKAQHAITALQKEKKVLEVELEGSKEISAEMERNVANVQQELTESKVQQTSLEQKVTEMENKIASLVNLNQKLSEKNNMLKDRESKLASQVQELQRREEEAVRSTAVRSKRKNADMDNDSNTSTARSALVDMSVNSVKPLDDPVRKTEATTSRKKRVCFETTVTEANEDSENITPIDAAAARKTRAEELARWKLMKSSSSGVAPSSSILDCAADQMVPRPVHSSSLLSGGSMRKFGSTTGCAASMLSGSSFTRTKSTGRSAMGLGLPSRIFDSDSSTASGMRRLPSRK